MKNGSVVCGTNSALMCSPTFSTAKTDGRLLLDRPSTTARPMLKMQQAGPAPARFSPVLSPGRTTWSLPLTPGFRASHGMAHRSSVAGFTHILHVIWPCCCCTMRRAGSRTRYGPQGIISGRCRLPPYLPAGKMSRSLAFCLAYLPPSSLRLPATVQPQCPSPSGLPPHICH